MSSGKAYDSHAPEEQHVCPWQIVRLFDNFLRPLVHNPRKLFGPYVRKGMTVLDIGCGTARPFRWIDDYQVAIDDNDTHLVNEDRLDLVES